MYVCMYVCIIFIYDLLLAPLLLYNSNTTSILLNVYGYCLMYMVITLSVALGFTQHLTLQKIWN